MKFSIATPVFNGMPAVKQCVGSVRNQSYKDWEHIVQDGGSTDGTAEWLATQDGLNSESRTDNGMYDAINNAWQRSTGDVLSWLNSDEQYLPRTLETVARCLDANPDIDAVFGDGIVVDKSGQALAARKEIPLRDWYAINGTLYVMSCTLFVRRRILDRVGMLDTSFRIVGDKDWIMRLLRGGARFLHISSFLGLFSVSGQNLTLTPGGAEESERVRQKYGAYRYPLLRLFPRLCRYTEKAVRGCYGRHRVQYDFVQNELPESIHIETRVTSRWKWTVDASQ